MEGTMNDADPLDPVAEDQRWQVDPELKEGNASPGSVAMTLLGSLGVIVLVLYGINHSSDHSGAASTTAAAPPSPAAPPATAQNEKSARPLTSNIGDQPPKAARSPADAAKAVPEPRVTPQQAGQPTGSGQSGPSDNTGAAPKH
jgi:hypothetical protein